MSHIAEITPEGDGFRVTCPHGCPLGTSEYQQTRLGAEKRVELHKLCTTPLNVRPQ